ncbi:Mov34/MPN/PAD-1 family protein [Euryhalocaulis caribicus]|uniref:Mov34/MPN/PAD-1 family protein n=1 Tax=Euryhalocaulis caribicus TaxID=1161401 RepID=UPI0003B7B2B2|nr:Mov34/MPN/PAD-1 family protein [Euryhalocaulis caribicus]
MLNWIKAKFFEREPVFKLIENENKTRFLIPESCFRNLVTYLNDASTQGHEGVVLFLGKGNGETKVALQCVQPKATTTQGSFKISSAEMAKVINLATDLDLEIIAQVHTHPREAFHSKGDDEGARIRYEGYLSLVIPTMGGSCPILRAPHFMNSAKMRVGSSSRSTS